MFPMCIRLFTPLLLVLLHTTITVGSSNFPLAPPDVSSPRATMESFIFYTDAFYKAVSAQERDVSKEKNAMTKAILCFDLSNLPPKVRANEGKEAVLQLYEIFSRMSLPELTDIPGKDEVPGMDVALRLQDISNEFSLGQWRVPHTEITIGRATKGSRAGAFLFTPSTVKHLDQYYNAVRDLPYRNGIANGIYEMYIYSSGWLIPDGFISTLPDWLKRGYNGQALWQWIGLVLSISAGCLLFCFLLYCHTKKKRNLKSNALGLSALFVTLSGIAICFFIEYVLDIQINITGKVMTVSTILLEFIIYILAAWSILLTGNIVRHLIITSRHIDEKALDADVIKLTCNLVSIALVLIICFQAFSQWGLSLNTIFASAGIVGLAVALAARETLANFFGGISIFLDRPFRAGDYIVLDTGERGEIKAVGMRSTRLQTRDDIMITIPNSVITNVKIVNQSAPKQNFRVHIKIGVAYDSDLDKVEKTLLEVAAANPLACKTPPPKVRLRTFGESSINFELLTWAMRPHDRGRLTHELSKEIHRLFNKNGIEIPLPHLVIQHSAPDKT